MTAVVMVVLAAAVAAWVLAPLRNIGPADPRARGGARDETAREESGDGGPGGTTGQTPGGER